MIILVGYIFTYIAGRSDYRNGGGHDGHPSGVPRSYGGGHRRGRGGRGSYNNREMDGGYSGGGDGGGSKRSSVQSQTGSAGSWASGW